MHLLCTEYVVIVVISFDPSNWDSYQRVSFRGDKMLPTLKIVWLSVHCPAFGPSLVSRLWPLSSWLLNGMVSKQLWSCGLAIWKVKLNSTHAPQNELKLKLKSSSLKRVNSNSLVKWVKSSIHTALIARSNRTF